MSSPNAGAASIGRTGDASSSGSPCERCNERPGETYHFSYGRKLGEEEIGGNMVRHTWRRGGDVYVALCPDCIRRHKLLFAVPSGIASLLLGAFAYFAYLNPDLGPGEPDREIFWIASAAGAICFIAFLFYGLSRRKYWGEKTAISVRAPELRTQGWDCFWKSNEEPGRTSSQ